MPRRSPSFLTMLAAVLMASSAAAAHPAAPHAMAETAPLTDAAAQAALVVDAFHAALKTGDTAKAAGLMADDALIFEAGHVERSKAEYAAEHLPGDAAYAKIATSTVLRRTGTAADGLAWIATEGRVQARSGDKLTDRLSTESMILRSTPAGWRIVHVHWSSRAAPAAH